MGRDDESDSLLAEQVAYYRAIAPEYEDHVIPGPGEDELIAALEAFRPTGDVLELACGPGAWTERLVRHARSVTAVDAAPEMVARAKARVGENRVRFVQADLFGWTPDRRYDVVFFSAWISHVPLDRFDAFWSLVADCLRPTGRFFFIDDAYRTAEELIEGESFSTIRRRLNDGSEYRAVKVAYRPAALEGRLRRLGWQVNGHRDFRPVLLGAGHAGPCECGSRELSPLEPRPGDIPAHWPRREDRFGRCQVRSDGLAALHSVVPEAPNFTITRT